MKEYAPSYELPSCKWLQLKSDAMLQVCVPGLGRIFSAPSMGSPYAPTPQKAQLMRSCVRNKRKLAAFSLGYFVPAAFHLEAQKNTILATKCGLRAIQSQLSDKRCFGTHGFPQCSHIITTYLFLNVLRGHLYTALSRFSSRSVLASSRCCCPIRCPSGWSIGFGSAGYNSATHVYDPDYRHHQYH